MLCLKDKNLKCPWSSPQFFHQDNCTNCRHNKDNGISLYPYKDVSDKDIIHKFKVRLNICHTSESTIENYEKVIEDLREYIKDLEWDMNRLQLEWKRRHVDFSSDLYDEVKK